VERTATRPALLMSTEVMMATAGDTVVMEATAGMEAALVTSVTLPVVSLSPNQRLERP